MRRYMIELRCQRRPKQHTYDGAVLVYEVGPDFESSPKNSLGFAFTDKGLEHPAAELHYATRLLSCRPNTEFAIRMLQKAPNSDRAPVPMDLTPEQVNKIYESVESAQLFFAPMFRERKEKEDVTENE